MKSWLKVLLAVTVFVFLLVGARNFLTNKDLTQYTRTLYAIAMMNVSPQEAHAHGLPTDPCLTITNDQIHEFLNRCYADCALASNDMYIQGCRAGCRGALTPVQKFFGYCCMW
jgi:hypothetical protein